MAKPTTRGKPRNFKWCFILRRPQESIRTKPRNVGLIGGKGFAGAAGQLHYVSAGTDADGKKIYLIEGDVNGDQVADFQVEVHVLGQLETSDFIF